MGELAYREYAFLVDKQALPHPGLDGDALGTVIAWAVLVALMSAFAFWAWRRKVQCEDIGLRLAKRHERPLVLLVLFLLALVVRVVGIGLQPADSQELTYLLQVVFPREVVDDPWLASLLTLLAPHMVSPHPPLYRLMMMLTLGDAHDLAWLRGPAAVAGAATVPALFLLGKQVFGRRVGLLAALLLAISPFHVAFSQSITPYTLVGLWAVLAYRLHGPALEVGGPWRAYVAVLSLGFLTHFSMPALFAPLAFEALWRIARGRQNEDERARFWRFVAAGAISLVPFVVGSLGLFFYREMIPHIFPMIHAMALFAPVESVGEALWDFLAGAMGFFWHGLSASFATPGHTMASLLCLCLAMVGGWVAWRRRGHPLVPAGVLLFALFFLALGGVTILGNGFFYFASRRFVPVVPLLLLLSVGGACVVWQALAKTRVGAMGSALALGLLLAWPVSSQAHRLVHQATEVVKPDMHGLVDSLAPHLREGDAISTGPYTFFDFLYSYHAPGQVPDWYQAGGAPRWVKMSPGDGVDAIRVMVSAGDITLPWEQVVTHAALKRVWLLEIDEAPYGLRELHGPGTHTADALEGADLEPCPDAPKVNVHGVRVRCYRARPTQMMSDKLEVGEGDYRQVMGMAPPGSVRSYARRLAPEGTLIFGEGGAPEALEMELLRWFEADVPLEVTIVVGESLQTEVLRLDKRRSTRRIELSEQIRRASGVMHVHLAVPTSFREEHGRCFRHRRERYRRGWLDCGVFVKRAVLTRSGTP